MGEDEEPLGIQARNVEGREEKERDDEDCC